MATIKEYYRNCTHINVILGVAGSDGLLSLILVPNTLDLTN